MSKPIKILSIIAVILSGFAVLLSFAVLTFLWKPINIYLNTPADLIGYDPIIPIGNMLYMFECLIIALLFLFTSKSKRVIAIEIIAIIFLTISPALGNYLNSIQTTFIGKFAGDTSLIVLGITTQSLFVSSTFIGICRCLCLIIGGMRIVEKLAFRKK